MEVMCFGLGVGHDVSEEVYLSSCRSCGVADIAAAVVFVMLDTRWGMRDSQESDSILRSRDGMKPGGTITGGGPVDGREPVAVHSVSR